MMGRSGPAVDMVPTFKTGNMRICLLLKSGQLGVLRTEDAERLQVGLFCSMAHQYGLCQSDGNSRRLGSHLV